MNLDIDIPRSTFATWMADIDQWNAATFGGGETWSVLIEEHLLELLHQHNLLVLISGVRCPDGSMLTVYRRPQEILEDRLLSVTVKPALFAVTLARDGEIRFALVGDIPAKLRQFVPKLAKIEQAEKALLGDK